MVKRIILQLISTIILLLVIVYIPAGVFASTPEEDPAIISFEQFDLNNDTTPDTAVIMADYLGGRYRVVVYDQGLDMKWSDDWRTGTDFVNDIWLFQTETGDQTKLIIRFSHSPEGYTAELFDDVNGDGIVSYGMRDLRQIDITESPFPTVRMVAQQPWTLPDGSINYLVRITGYRPLLDIAGSEVMNYLPQDGRPTIEREIVDSDADGVADYELALVFPDAPKDSGFFRAAINVNISKELLPAFTGYFLWPYLGFADPERWQSIQRTPENLFFPPILVDWQQGRIRRIASFLPLWTAGDRWAFLSIIPLAKHAINELDWEQFAYYNFAGSSTSDMVLRLIRSGPAETVRVGSRVLYLQKAAFSWHQGNLGTLKWDYKLELAGLHELPSTVVAFKDFMLREVPYEDMLREFTIRQWAYATFVAAESNGYASNEGIWEWGTLDGVVTDISLTLASTIRGSDRAHHEYLLGKADVLPAQYYTDIREGFRGEFGELNGPARLYFSPVDRKLHMLKAQKGVWNLGREREIHYKNLGGEYINQWTLLENGKLIKHLYTASGYVIYQDTAGIQLVHADMPPSLFTALPPRNHDEWVQLGVNLEKYKPTFEPDDFAAMFRQFDGPRFSVDRASLRDFRLTSDGFRLVLDLQPGFSVNGTVGPDLAGLQPGEYAVTYNGAFTVQPLTPARPQIVPDSLHLSDPSPVELEPIQIEALLENKGLEDLANLRVQALVSGPGISSAQVITETEVALLGGQTAPVHFDWSPPAPGEWQISIVWNSDNPRAAVISASQDATLKVDVAHRSPMDPETTWEISNVGQPIPLLLLLAGLGLGAAVVVILSLRGAGKS